MKPVTITHEGGTRFVADVRGHKVITDQPPGTGADTGPMPVELIGVSLGTCVALYVEQFCRARELGTEGMHVEVHTRGAQNPSRVGLFDVRVFLPGEVPAKYADAIHRVARSCTVHNTLMHAPEITVSVQSGAGAATS